MRALVPLDPGALGGPYVSISDDCIQVVSDQEKFVVAEFTNLPAEIKWFEDRQYMYCQRQHDPQVIKVLHKATPEEIRRFRVPIWIQGDEIPECCGRPMFFVGQIDDDEICCSPPADSKYWWHDAASFYVFTCSQCLECKAVGQQF